MVAARKIPEGVTAEAEAARLAKNRAYHAAYRAKHPELKQYYSARYQANKDQWKVRGRSEEKRAYMKDYRKRNRQHLYSLEKKWRASNPEKAREIESRHQVNRRPKKRLADAQYRKDKPEIVRGSIERAKAAKPDLYRQIQVKSSMKRRARKRAAITEIVSLERVIARDWSRCHLCLLTVDAGRSFDHLIPVVRNGAHAEWNLMLAHNICNKRRGTKQILPEETKEAALTYIATRHLDPKE